MVTVAQFAQGTLMQMGDGGSPEAFTTIADVRSIQGPSFSRDVLDVTNHSSPSHYREFLSGLKDPGEVSFDVAFNPNDPTHDETTGLISLFNTDTPTNFRIVFVNGLGRWNISGLLTGFQQNFPIDEAMTASVTIKVTGQPTLT